MTDPPTVPDGVTSVFIDYSNLAIHVSSAGNNTGWHVLGVGGQVDLMSVINSTQTIAKANISSGDFNALAFNVTSAIVTFNGVNYSADLVYQDHVLFVPIVGGINIIDGQASAAVIDLTPTVLLLGNVSESHLRFHTFSKSLHDSGSIGQLAAFTSRRSRRYPKCFLVGEDPDMVRSLRSLGSR